MYMYSHWHTGRSDAVLPLGAAATPRGILACIHPLSERRRERLQPAKSHLYTLWPSRRHARAGARSHEARCVTPDTTHPRSRGTTECRRGVRRRACPGRCVSVRRVGADEVGRDVNAKGRVKRGNQHKTSTSADVSVPRLAGFPLICRITELESRHPPPPPPFSP